VIAAVCPSSFTYMNEIRGCYKSVRINYNWNSAALYCQSLVPGGHLAFVTNSQESTAIIPLMDDTSG
jgi:hypothetical protein